MAAYLYDKDVLIVYRKYFRMKWAFYVLAGLFDHVVLYTNMGNMVIITCQPCCTTGGQSIEAYGL